jgi:Transposase IS4
VIERIPETKGFISLVDSDKQMSLNRFKQIRGAFHPEDKAKANGLEDKCCMIHCALNELNSASHSNFVPGSNLSFNEGGIACHFATALFANIIRTSRKNSGWIFSYLQVQGLTSFIILMSTRDEMPPTLGLNPMQ